MDNINTNILNDKFKEIEESFKPYEDKPVTYKDLVVILKSILEGKSQEQQAILDFASNVSVQSASAASSILAKELTYKRIRDLRFIITILDSLKLADKDAVYRSYTPWCEEYDKLNRNEDNQ